MARPVTLLAFKKGGQEIASFEAKEEGGMAL
jgi:hypothetical protein